MHALFKLMDNVKVNVYMEEDQNRGLADQNINVHSLDPVNSVHIVLTNDGSGTYQVAGATGGEQQPVAGGSTHHVNTEQGDNSTLNEDYHRLN